MHPVGDRVGWGDGDIGQSDGLKALLELAERERAGDAAGIGAALGSLLCGQRILGHDIGDADAAARPKDPRDLAEDGWLVGRQVDDAVADDHVDALGRERDRLDLALEELDVVGAGLGGVAPGQAEHLVGHVQAKGAPGCADTLGREEDVDAAARSQVEHPLALVQVRDGDRVAAAERRHDGRVRQLIPLQGGVQLRPDAPIGAARVAAACGLAVC